MLLNKQIVIYFSNWLATGGGWALSIGRVLAWPQDSHLGSTRPGCIPCWWNPNGGTCRLRGHQL